MTLFSVMRGPKQLGLELAMPTHWGGARAGSGRKPAPRARVWHRRRSDFPDRHPGLVTIRVRGDVPSLRTPRLVQTLERRFRSNAEQDGFRIVHYSIQHDHIHLLVEANDRSALASGMKSVGALVARAVNRIHNRRGSVVDGRFHHRPLATPREVRSALAYVLLNARKHAVTQGIDLGGSRPALDPASSARWFDGWAHTRTPSRDVPAVATPSTWLLRTGWRCHGLIRHDEVPGRH
jgi:REP element-mobilizing transposase RayT